MGAYLQLKNISKLFYHVKVLDQVSVDFEQGEIHVVIGENGAGKSTLMKIVAGFFKPEEGQIILDGQEVSFQNPLDAIGHHISMIHQELMPIPHLTVAQNIYLGREPVNRLGLLDHVALNQKAKELFEMIGVDINPKALMCSLSTAQVQLVEIAKAVSFQSKILIMDEPTSAISDKEIEKLYDLIFKLKADGVAIVFISHKLDEIFRVADKITVLRDGVLVDTKNAYELNKDLLISMMIGRDLTNIYYKVPAQLGEPVLEVRNLSKAGLFHDISFTLHKNEILGVSGLMGAGRTEVMETIFGMIRPDSGEIRIHGQPVEINSPSDAQKHGIALIPEDRKILGLNLKDSTGFNVSICSISNFIKAFMVDNSSENEAIERMIRDLNIKVNSRKTPVVSLSGGNQQKVVIAKWLLTEADILIMDEPTRGIDIGAKTEIYKLITQLVQNGKSVIMVSSELPEIIGMSDRVIVLCEGKLTGELTKDEISQQAIMRHATQQAATH